jgi:hypothetical protein
MAFGSNLESVCCAADLAAGSITVDDFEPGSIPEWSARFDCPMMAYGPHAMVLDPWIAAMKRKTLAHSARGRPSKITGDDRRPWQIGEHAVGQRSSSDLMECRRSAGSEPIGRGNAREDQS